MFDTSQSQSFQVTETTTNVDSFNKTFNSTSNISDAGNVSIQLPSPSGAGGSSTMLILMIGLAIGLFFVFRKLKG